MNPATIALIFLLLSILLWLFLIIAPWKIHKTFPHFKLKTWGKCLLSISFGVIGAGLVFILFINWALLSITNLSRRPKYAKMFLEECAIDIDMPKFKVLDHTFQFIGGDDTETRWEVKFKKPLSDEFVETLDSLCRSTSDWYYDRPSHSYNYIYWHPDNIELRDCVSISPEIQRATFQHIKI